MTLKLFTLNVTLYICTSIGLANGTDSTNNMVSRLDHPTIGNSCPVIDISQLIIKEDTCEQHLGFIKNIKITGAVSYQWIDVSGKVAGTAPDLEKISTGHYKLVASNEQCTVESLVIEIRNHMINVGKRFDSSLGQLVSDVSFYLPDSGKQNGFIKINSLYATNNEQASLTWRDKENKVVGSGMLLDKIGAGTYTITIETTSGCINTADTYILPNYVCKLGYDDTQLQITPAPCNKSIGSIKGVSIKNAYGVIKYQWVDSLNRIAGNGTDLVNVAGGKYRLKFIDESRCDTISTPYYFVESPKAIFIDSTQLNIKASQCIEPTGAISGLKAPEAEFFEWKDQSGGVISHEMNPSNLFPGTYILRASNKYGCEMVSGNFFIPVSPETVSPSLFQVEQQVPRCDSANGSIAVRGFPDAQHYTFRWVNSSKREITLSTSLELREVPASEYILYATNAKGCEQKVTTVYFDRMPAPKIDRSNLVYGDDLCEQGIGFIKDLKISEGTPPFTIAWSDENNKVINSNLDISKLYQGKYTLQVSDKMNCKDSSLHIIQNKKVDFRKPGYNNITIPVHSQASFTVLNYQQGNYLLFDTVTATVPVQENTSGNFTTGPLVRDQTYYVLLKTRSCESEKSAVTVKVIEETRVFIPTGFTPNRDGKNDLLKPGVYGQLQQGQFIVYDRWGAIVFQSKDMNQGWDGTNRGKDLPTGVYAWALKGKDILGNVIQKQGTVLLIR